MMLFGRIHWGVVVLENESEKISGRKMLGKRREEEGVVI